MVRTSATPIAYGSERATPLFSFDKALVRLLAHQNQNCTNFSLACPVFGPGGGALDRFGGDATPRVPKTASVVDLCEVLIGPGPIATV